MTQMDAKRFVRIALNALLILLVLGRARPSSGAPGDAGSGHDATSAQSADAAGNTRAPPAASASGDVQADAQKATDAGTSNVVEPDAAEAPKARRPLPVDTPPPRGRAPVVVRADIRETITQVSDDIIRDALALAVRERAQALLLVMDTPGGVLDATRSIVRRMLSAPVPVILFIAPAGAHAGSAGVFLSLAAHVTLMQPTSNIGAAHPVAPFGQDIKGDVGKKVVNDTAAWAKSLAETRGRNVQWAEKAVRESVSLTATEAVAQHVVDGTALDVADALRKADGRVVEVADRPWKVTTRGARVVQFELGFAEHLYEALSSPGLVYLLLLVGLLGLYIEFQHPGLIVPGVLGATALGIVIGVQMLPLNSFGLLLIGLAAVLFFAEVYVTSFGLLGAAGVACLIAGSYLLFDVPGSAVRLGGWTIWSVALTLSASLLWIGYKLVAIKRQGATSGSEFLIGQVAQVVEAIRPDAAGKVFFDGTLWTATAASALERGVRCRVVGRSGLTVRVAPLEHASDPVDPPSTQT
ncbi:MAG: ATP-dependent Clp protease proteolytic subunit [Polyangiaceae bacterium]|nr:ATP-dependent Clp protease proteolytic subunit [Polyangiaceae bacterium]